eukprot:TRINITY_DN1708_c0_g1_i2.p1 TRINITY_DN1708_c0_g1~~TRINITY_DN1708_c0_g1_i2.p1  ORF type:complete len:193 (+),score=20.77 TRINITY_DN1708_c0_g1_i2:189-767(+)
MWKKIKVKGLVPTPRNCVSGSANDNLFIVFGGYGRSEKERFSDVFAFNPAEKKWIQPEVSGDVPTPRYCTSLNFWEDKLVSFGGFDGNRLNTLHLLDTVTWEWKFVVTNSEIPEPRSHHTACIVGNRLIVFGGLSQEGKRLADLHVLDLSSSRKLLSYVLASQTRFNARHSAFRISYYDLVTTRSTGKASSA